MPFSTGGDSGVDLASQHWLSSAGYGFGGVPFDRLLMKDQVEGVDRQRHSGSGVEQCHLPEESNR